MWGAQHRVVSGAWIDENDEWMASEELEWLRWSSSVDGTRGHGEQLSEQKDHRELMQLIHD